MPACANELSYWSLQSGPGAINVTSGPTPLYDHGIHGEGQIIALLDTGVDYRSCYFAEPDGAAPPINTGSPALGFFWQNVVPSRRKIIAYDFLYSCDQFPGAVACDDPSVPTVYDKQGHGTHAAGAAVGDTGTPIAHDYADAIATGAKLIVQDAGFGSDGCTQRPGIGCPVNLTPILDQAYRQGARIHSNSWGDAQGLPFAPPTGNYAPSARDVDAFVWSHPDMLVVFNTGNYGSRGQAPPSSLSAPGCAKNTLQVGGTRSTGRNDNWLAPFSLAGPTRDGRIKPDVVGPAYVVGCRCERDHGHGMRHHLADRHVVVIADDRRCCRAGPAVLHRRLLPDWCGHAVERDHAERRAAQGDDHRVGSQSSLRAAAIGHRHR